ncbi:unnamed protein product [Callosobruchus maculatus]|uniref:Ig-like domain-containing protein n=1 Tax=Callosobruchus maculatus TaxID=64391 RepID=A0A653CW19_CALMS|nr:unnamed protein product [Callosobruchus maculatus]
MMMIKICVTGLSNLVELDLSRNLIETIPTGAWVNCPSLMRLSLNENPISTVKRLAFNHLPYLTALELSNCVIEDIEEDAFLGLHTLERLTIDGNKLQTIPGRKTLPENLKDLQLHNNPWQCDCHALALSSWLVDTTVPLTEPLVCAGPPRLQDRHLADIPLEQLACLPDVQPTAFYLELAEGKNVSLLCHVHAVPEATVSWWFQGRMLQNDTMIAPGVHLVYYVEEGSENKRSELFIYNANAEDNGTFICNADNAAGNSQSNFTIRIVLKENPIVIIVSFPLEYFLVAVIGISILGVIVLIVIVVLVVRCLRRKERKVDKVGQYDKSTTKRADGGEGSSISAKTMNTTNSSHEETITIRDGPPTESTFTDNSFSPSRSNTNGLRSPVLSVRQYQIEQNPDIIDGTDSIPGRRREGDGEDQKEHEKGAVPVEMPPSQFPVVALSETSELYADGRCIVDTEGYPVDYGLPKVPCRQQHPTDGYYRTLPTNRLKRQTAANPLKRFSREAEFLSRSVDSPYDYRADIRYTADGYPARTQPPLYQPPQNLPPEALAPASLPYCRVQWPACVPANLHLHQPIASGIIPPRHVPTRPPLVAQRRSASAQTDTESESDYSAHGSRKAEGQRTRSEVTTESPDEGYVGEPSIV